LVTDLGLTLSTDLPQEDTVLLLKQVSNKIVNESYNEKNN